MKRAIQALWRRHPLVSVGFGLAVIISLVFAIRGLMFAGMLWMRAEQPVEGWMTPRFIALAYGIGVREVEAALGLTDADARGVSLDRLAGQTGQPVAEVMAPINALIRSKAAE